MSAPASMQAAWWAAAAAVLLGWVFAPTPEPAPALVKPRRDTWTLVPLPRLLNQTALAAEVMGAPYWGAQATGAGAAQAAPTLDPRWRVAAIYGSRSERAVLIVYAAEGKPPQQLHVGDQLPSGHRIVRVDEREICVQIGARSYRLGVERSAN